MGLESRRNNYYRYRKRRVGNRVNSEYCGGGGGEIARLMQFLDEAERQEADNEKKKRRKAIAAEKQGQADIDQDLEVFSKEANALKDAVFLISGYQTPKTMEKKTKWQKNGRRRNRKRLAIWSSSLTRKIRSLKIYKGCDLGSTKTTAWFASMKLANRPSIAS
jgi:hypothetical protein